MPHKDPVTGVMVMTLSEFFEKEGERNGRSGVEEYEDYVAEFEKTKAEDDERFRQPENVKREVESLIEQENKFRKDENEYAEKHISPDSAYSWEPYEPIPPIARVLEVIRAEQHYGMFGGGSSTRIEVRVEFEDGRTGTLKAEGWETPGTRIDPPDGDMTIEWSFDENTDA